MSELQVTPASQWGRKTQITRLPSGVVAELRKPDILSLMLREGHSLPKALTQQFLSGLSGGKQNGQTNNFADSLADDPKSLEAIANLMDILCRAAFANPCIVDNPNYDAGQISIDDVEATDKMWVMTWAMEGMGQVAQVENFLPGKSGSVEASPESSQIRDTAESDSGD